jgi:hypothetical protein
MGCLLSGSKKDPLIEAGVAVNELMGDACPTENAEQIRNGRALKG